MIQYTVLRKQGGILKIYIIPIMMVFAFLCDAQGAVKVKNNTATHYEEKIELAEGEDAADIATLENDIRILDEEIAKCKKQKKGWIAATVIGAVGTVSTGIAAGVQGAKIKEKKNELNDKKTELRSLTTDLNTKKDELNKLNNGETK